MFDAIKGYFVSFFKENKAKDYLVSLFKGSRAKHKGEKVFLTINGLCSLYHKVFHLKNSEKVKNFTVDRVLPLLESFKDDINNLENESPAMMKLLCSTPEYEELHEDLKELSDLARKCDYVPGSESYKEFCSLISEVVQGFKLPNLKDKIKFLGLLKVTKNLTATRKAYNDDWFFCDVINDKDFEEYVNEAVGEEDGPTSKDLKKDIDKCRGLIRQGEDIASKYFRKKEVIFQAYCEETEDDNKILNVNLINYDKSKPIRISDILRQEEDVDKLDIYCRWKREVRAFRDENNERHYRFEKGAHYEMTSTWPIKDESGNISTCTMVMDVSNDGITKIVKFNGENFESPSKEFWEPVEQNEELYIQGSSLCDAVEEFLEMQRNREDIIRKGEDGKRDSSLPDVVAGSSSTPSTNNNASESTEEAATHTGGNPLLDDDVFFDCTEGLKGVVVGDDNHASCGSFPVSTTPPTTSRNTRPPGS